MGGLEYIIWKTALTIVIIVINYPHVGFLLCGYLSYMKKYVKKYLDSIFKDIEIRQNEKAIGGRVSEEEKIFLYIISFEIIHFSSKHFSIIVDMFGVSYFDARDIIEEYIKDNYIGELGEVHFFMHDL